MAFSISAISIESIFTATHRMRSQHERKVERYLKDFKQSWEMRFIYKNHFNYFAGNYIKVVYI